MAMDQEARHELGRRGEGIMADAISGATTNHKAPFDIVDFNMGVAYEVKTMAGLSKDLKIHITDKSMARKLEFANRYHLDAILFAVVIYSATRVEVYRGPLANGIRVSNMTKVADSADAEIADSMRDYWKNQAALNE